MIREKRKTYPVIRKLILNEFSRGERTVNEIAKSTGLTWRTVDGHLTWLIGKGLIEPVFVSSYVKIYRKKEHSGQWAVGSKQAGKNKLGTIKKKRPSL